MESDNTSAAVAFSVSIPFADLIVDAVVAPTGAQSEDVIQVTYRVRNQGTSTTNATSWVDRIVLSADAMLDDADVELARVTRNAALAKGLNVCRGRIVHPGVAESVGETAAPLEGCLAS